MTHRATELSLSMAAEQLFDSLPKASRESLGDVPGLLQRLHHDAHQLRGRFDSLQEALRHATGGAASDALDTLSEQRDAIQERLRTTVGALESIRLGLLRLHAGSLTLDGLTTHLGHAADVSADVDRLIAAHHEVDAVLRYPANVELTPV
jgi:hypothetical protein